MTNPFKTGDKLIVVDANQSAKMLTFGQEVTVERVAYNRVFLTGSQANGAGWDITRFQPASAVSMSLAPVTTRTVRHVTAVQPMVPQVTMTLRQDANGVTLVAEGGGDRQSILSIVNGRLTRHILSDAQAARLGFVTIHGRIEQD